MAKSRSKSKTARRGTPWYLIGEDEVCPHCGLLYAYELEFRCPDCDSPSCPDCKSKHADERFVCLACVAITVEGAAHGG